MSTSIAVAGSILTDYLREIASYPQEGELAPIHQIRQQVGGCVPNVAMDLKRLDASLSVMALGRVGKDDAGHFVLEEMKQAGVDCSAVSITDDHTSFTDVMSVPGGQRTFFSYVGANANFSFSDIPWENLHVERLHLGYFLLLPKVDQGEGRKILQEAKRRGIATSIDLVSSSEGNYTSLLPCLPYVDDLIINEVEAGRLTGLSPTFQNMGEITKRLREEGVRQHVIIHAPEYGVIDSKKGFFSLPSYRLPSGWIKGSTGAGDAFCAGALLSLLRHQEEMEILKTAQVAASMALTSSDAVSGLCDFKEAKQKCASLERRILC